MRDQSISFGTNLAMAIIPAIFMSAFFLLFQFQRDFFWGWLIMLIFGGFSLMAFLSQWKTYRFDKDCLLITGLFSSQKIDLSNVRTHNKKTLTRRGIHYYTWTLELTNGKTVRIMSDYIENHEAFRKAMGLWLEQKG